MGFPSLLGEAIASSLPRTLLLETRTPACPLLAPQCLPRMGPVTDPAEGVLLQIGRNRKSRERKEGTTQSWQRFQIEEATRGRGSK